MRMEYLLYDNQGSLKMNLLILQIWVLV